MFARRRSHDEAGANMAIDVIPPAPQPRQPRRAAFDNAGRVADAEFEEFKAAAGTPRFAEIRSSRFDPAPSMEEPGDCMGAGQRISSRSFWVVLVLLSAAAFWISGGHALAKLKPRDNFYVSEVSSHVVATRLGDVLFVTGRVENSGDRAKPLPDVTVMVGDAFTTADFISATDRLAAGGSVAFEARIARPELLGMNPQVQLHSR